MTGADILFILVNRKAKRGMTQAGTELRGSHLQETLNGVPLVARHPQSCARGLDRCRRKKVFWNSGSRDWGLAQECSFSFLWILTKHLRTKSKALSLVKSRDVCV